MNDIDILEKVIDTYNNWNELPYHFNKDIIQAISNLISENKELKENSIPKSKIEEKIEELYDIEWVFNEIRDEIILVLQELLEED